MLRIPIHCSLETFLKEYEGCLPRCVTTLTKDGDMIVEGCIKLIFGVGGYYPDSAIQVVKEHLSL